MDLFIDIETIPAQGAIADALRLRLKDDIKPPAKMTKFDTIEAWYRDEQPGIIEEKLLKTSLDGGYGEIAVIGWAVDDGPVQTLYRTPDQSEAGMLLSFFTTLLGQVGQHYTRKIGHNVIGFDLRFLYQRCVIRGVKPVVALDHDAKYNGERVFDTMLAWAGWKGYVKQSELCAALGLPCSKGDIDGSLVWPMIQDGKIKEIADYCAGDVEDCRRIFRRMQFLDMPAASVPVAAEEEAQSFETAAA